MAEHANIRNITIITQAACGREITHGYHCPAVFIMVLPSAHKTDNMLPYMIAQ